MFISFCYSVYRKILWHKKNGKLRILNQIPITENEEDIFKKINKYEDLILDIILDDFRAPTTENDIKSLLKLQMGMSNMIIECLKDLTCLENYENVKGADNFFSRYLYFLVKIISKN